MCAQFEYRGRKDVSSETGSWVTATLRHDGGDGATGTGAELDAGLSYEAPDLAFSTRLRGYCREGRWARPVADIVPGCPLGRPGKAGAPDRNPVRPSLRDWWARFLGDSCERRRLRELVRAVGPRINGDSARCHPMKPGKARLLGREGNCRNSKGCDIAILRTGRAKRWSESGDYVITALVTPKSNRVF